MNSKVVRITVDGEEIDAQQGEMLIGATDRRGIDIPRFCYHHKLSVVANCRMCLVEVEKSPQPLPACATPITEGMVVHTRSAKALEAQRGTMEFLLINHPLDCPICDQGGECELQDVARKYGAGVSRYSENKRVVFDKNLGPLVATDMTRCIHCTRCVRFGQEIAGLKELGATGRGEDMRIETFVEKSLESELSGNIIDLCPVGALTAKPSRFKARAWELEQTASVAAHDCVGSNLYYHSFRGRVIRAVPRENEDINEVWLSDRDRFSYEGLYSDDRLHNPRIKEDGIWRDASWQEALDIAANRLEGVIGFDGDQLGCLASPSATSEELFLLQKIARAHGSSNIDHRLRQIDFSDPQGDPVMPWLGCDWPAFGKLESALLIASNIRKDQPIAGLRLRKAASEGAAVHFLNPCLWPQHFEVASETVVPSWRLWHELVGIAKALDIKDEDIKPLLADAEVTGTHHRIADDLRNRQRAHVFLGSHAFSHPHFTTLRRLAQAVAVATGALLGYLPPAANACGAWLVGAVPHRGPGGAELDSAGADSRSMLESPRRAYLLLDQEPEHEYLAEPKRAHAALEAAKCVISLTAYVSPAMERYADVLLPIACAPENEGSLINVVGLWQSLTPAVAPPGEARPAWKVLRALADQLSLDDFSSYIEIGDITKELRKLCWDTELENGRKSRLRVPRESLPPAFGCSYGAAVHDTDSLVRRARSLQMTPDAVADRYLHISPEAAQRLRVSDQSDIKVTRGGLSIDCQVRINKGVPTGAFWMSSALAGGTGFACDAWDVELLS